MIIDNMENRGGNKLSQYYSFACSNRSFIWSYLINKYMPWLFDLRILIMCKFS